MNKVTKGLCLFAACLMVLGIAMAGSAWLLGAKTHMGYGPWNSDFDRRDAAYMAEKSEDVGAFTGIDIDVEYQEVYIEKGDSFHISSRYDQRYSQISWEVTDGVLSVSESILGRENKNRGIPWDMIRRNRQSGTLTITFPEGTELSMVSVDSDAAGVYVTRGQIQSLKVDAAMGSVELTDTAVGSLEVDAAMGNIDLEDSSADTVKLSCRMGSVETDNFVCRARFECEADMGSIELSGDLRGETILDCDLGSVSLDLAGKAAEYGYDLDASLGGVEVDGSDMGGRATAQGPGEDHLRIRTSAGDIEVNFGD